MLCRGLGIACAVFLAAATVIANEPGALPQITLENAAGLNRLHEESVRVSCVAWIPQTQQILRCGWQEPLHIHDGRTLAHLEELPTPRTCTQFAVSAVSGHLAWTAGTSAVTIVDLNTGETQREFEVGEPPVAMALSPDGALLATTSSKDVEVWDTQDGERLCILPCDVALGLDRNWVDGGRIRAPAFSPDGRRLVAWDRGAQTHVFDLAQHAPLFEVKKSFHSNVQFSPDGTLLAAVGADAALTLWDAETGVARGKAQTNCASAYSVAWSPRGDLVATCGRDGPLQLWNPQTLKVVAELETGLGRLTQVSFSPDGTRLLTCGGAPRILANRSLAVCGASTTND